MAYSYCLLVVVFMCGWFTPGSPASQSHTSHATSRSMLQSALHHYEALHKDQITQKVNRGYMSRLEDELKEVQFTSHGRSFRLILSPSTELFHPQLRYRSSHGIRYDQFFRGHVFGEESSHVTAHVNGEGILTAVIRIGSETYYVEPSHRHIKEPHDYHMITYKRSDLKYNMTGKSGTPYCGVKADDHAFFNGHAHFADVNNRLKKRQTVSAAETVTVCPIYVEATYSFYRRFGGNPLEKEQAINYLLLVMNEIDAIYRSTNWVIPNVQDSASPGIKGLQVAAINVITDENSGPAYNQDTNRQSNDLLRQFSTVNWGQYCLAHLVIANPFVDSGRLGVAYIANANSFLAGGICSRNTFYDNQPFSGNTGVSTFRSSTRILLLAESVIVMAHEIGHNWGAQHDDTTDQECSPSQDNGGKFLMYPVAQDGSFSNNDNFSICSIRSISRVLNTHESVCFVAPQNNLCGNYRIDPGEECDPGPSSGANGDTCCANNCTLKSGKSCSDVNHDCCHDCSPKVNGTVCLLVQEGNSKCLVNHTCNGVNITCPIEDVFATNGTSCGILGECVNMTSNPDRTECMNFCELQGFTTCYCSGADQCKVCCLESGKCDVYQFQELNLPDGSFCEGGFCQNGMCQLTDVDLANYLFDLLTGFNTDAIARAIKENIVGSVLIITLIIWIPGSAFVHIFDLWWEKRRSNKEEETKKKRNRKRGKDDKISLTEDVDIAKPLLSADPEHDPITLHVSVSGVDKKSFLD